MAANKWWTSQTLAVVTGANKGIGFEVVRQLAENGLTVVLTARDAIRGLTATKTLHDHGLNNVVFRQLDIQSPRSISDFASWLEANYGGLDILVNNAAILGSEPSKEARANSSNLVKKTDLFTDPNSRNISRPNYEGSKVCFEINYYGTKKVVEELLPLFRSSLGGARIVNVSSDGGLLQWINNDYLRSELSDDSKISEELIDKMLESFLEDVKSGALEGNGWPYFMPQYCISKVALNTYTRLLVQKLSINEGGRKISINNVHPGRVQTDMTHYNGDLTMSQGAENVVRVVMFPPNGPSGQFYSMKQVHHF